MAESQFEAPPEAVAKAQEVMQTVLIRSATDPTFRARLLTDPRQALAAHSGREVPEEWNVVFIENDADLTIVLPDPIDSSGELCETELEAVAGGASPATFILAAKGVFALATLAAVWWAADQIEGDGVCRE